MTHRRLHRRPRRADRGARVRPLPRRARWCGVKVLRFSVGFGRALCARRLRRGPHRVGDRGDPVRRLREDARRARRPGARRTELARAFNRQSVWQALRHRRRRAGRQLRSSRCWCTPGFSCTGCPRRGRCSARRPPARSPPRPGCTRAIRCARSTASRSLPGRSCAGACCRRRCSARPVKLDTDGRARAPRDGDARPARFPVRRGRDATCSSASGCASTGRRSAGARPGRAGGAGRARRPHGGRPHRRAPTARRSTHGKRSSPRCARIRARRSR